MANQSIDSPGAISRNQVNARVSGREAGDNPTDTAKQNYTCLLYTSPSPRDATLSRMPSSA